MTTKVQRKAIVDEKVSAEKARILKIMNLSDLYTITLDPLIESYLDIFEIYQHKYLLWKEKGFQRRKNSRINQGPLINRSIHWRSK